MPAQNNHKEKSGKLEYQGKKTLRAKNRTNNKLNPHMMVQESNPGHIGGRRALSPLCHPSSPKLHILLSLKQLVFTFKLEYIGKPGNDGVLRWFFDIFVACE